MMAFAKKIHHLGQVQPPHTSITLMQIIITIMNM